MTQSHFVGQDEEILSVVGRMKMSPLVEIEFIVPKRALILQSVVNLRILAREASKCGKRVTITTQDEQGRAIAAKAGIPTHAYAGDGVAEDDLPLPDKEADRPEPVRYHRDDTVHSIGSSDFYSDPFKTASPQPPRQSQSGSPAPGTNMAIRTERPESERHRQSPQPVRPSTPVTPVAGMRGDMRASQPQRTPPVRVAVHPQMGRPPMRTAAPVAPPERVMPASRREPPRTPIAVEGRMTKLFRHDQDEHEDKGRFSPGKDGEVRTSGYKWLIAFITLSVLGLAGAVAFILLPKADVLLYPKTETATRAFSYRGALEGAEPTPEFVIRPITSEIDISVTEEATGSAVGNAGKSRGSVIIYNSFGKDPQSLVSTTRLESSDGRIYRIVRGVTVPGMTEVGGKLEPGAIEVEAVADGSGEEYDRSQGEFTIPGFKGGPKYSGFKAVVKSPFTGGSTGDGSDAKAVSDDDLISAARKAEREFRDRFAENVRKMLRPGETFVPEGIVVEVVGAPTRPPVGVVSSMFDYKVKFRGSVMAFEDRAIMEHAVALLGESMNRDRLTIRPEHISLSYLQADTDVTKGTLSLSVSATAKAAYDIDLDAVTDDLLGRSKDEFNAFLDTHQEVRELKIELKPSYFTFKIPTDRDRVRVTVVESEE